MSAKLMVMLLSITARRQERERGATATEYALLVAFIAALIVLGVTAFGEALDAFFDELAAWVDGFGPVGGT